MVKKIGRPRKDGTQHKGSYLQVRLTAEQGAIFDAAAEAAGLDKSSWVRDRLLTVARAELRKAGKVVTG